MSIPTVYTSADASAPQITSATAGTGLAVIRACLVDGYGSKAAAGWTEEFTGTNKAVFRNSLADGGTGCYVRVDDSSTSSSNPPMSIRTYRTMTDVDTGSDPTHVVYCSRSPNGTNPVSWVLVATPLAFYFTAVGSSTNVHRSSGGAGDLVGYVPGDAFRYFAMGNTSAIQNTAPPFLNGSQNPWGNALATATGLSLGADDTGLVNPCGGYVIAPNVPGVTVLVGGRGYPALPAQNSAAAAAMPAYVTHGSGATAVIRGRLPGILIPLFNGEHFESGAVTVPDILPGSTTRWLKWRDTSSGGAGMAGLLVETSLGWV
jgi:hypothetical protein